jgi:Eco57I restriction-modification methylase
MSVDGWRVACSGALLSRSVLESIARSSDARVDAALARALRRLVRDAPTLRALGARALADAFSRPLMALLGYQGRGARTPSNGFFVEVTGTSTEAVAIVLSIPYAEPLRSARPSALAIAARERFRWCFILNGADLALLDCTRAHARRSLVFNLKACAADLRSLQALVAVAGASALESTHGGASSLEQLIAESDADLRAVRAALQSGVERAALALTAAFDRTRVHRTTSLEALFEQSLTVVYRILFLRFAESRGLVPVWHPTYRRSYTIESLRELIDGQRETRGVWDALQAIARLAHRGAKAGDLSVMPFNGRLFSPSHAPVVAATSIPDTSAAALVSALTSREDQRGRRVAIAYSDLGVEQLGSIYERVLEFSPAREPHSRAPLLRRGDSRKATGSFYTPRSLTEFVVRRTLDPLTKDASSEQILSLKVLDAAMGSGAFLVAACRELARAYEQALLREGVAGAGEWSPAERAGFRRLIAQRCLYGVDLNPMAVQLGRLSLWLCSLASDKPLTFLDHRLRTGNSILGASPHDVMARAPGAGRAGTPTLFGDDVMEVVGRALEIRNRISAIPDDSVAQVREKESMLARLDSGDGPLARWRRVCDLWCACWFWDEDAAAPRAREFGAMCDALGGERSLTPPDLLRRLERAASIAREKRFFHWQLEFPEVFAHGGFDAIVGNPPWDMVRGNRESRQSLRFTRDSGTFLLQSSGHANLYQLCLERILQLARPGGRIGVVLPWGLATDHGSAELRRHLLGRCTMDEMPVLDNRRGIFPIHRGLRFCVLMLRNAGSSGSVRYRPAICDPADLDAPAGEEQSSQRPVELSSTLLRTISGPSLAIPYVESQADVRVLERLAAAAPAAADPRGWGVQFSRELNASDDKVFFCEGEDGYPVISGRHIEPFRINAGESRLRIQPQHALERLGPAANRFRLAYRDVAGAGNRVTLIAAIVPPHVVTTHTLFCLKTQLDIDEQLFLCAILNSYVANYLVRTRVGTHVTTALVHALPIPRPRRDSEAFRNVVSLARLGGSAELQGAVAALYELEESLFSCILATFPLIPAAERAAAAAALTSRSAI